MPFALRYGALIALSLSAVSVGCSVAAKASDAPRAVMPRDVAGEPSSVLPVWGGPTDERACDGEWRRPPWEEERRCRSLLRDEKTAEGVGLAEAVARFNALSPIRVASDDGLYRALGLPSPQCGVALVTWRFTSSYGAEATQSRSSAGMDPSGETVTVDGDLEVSFEKGRVERIFGTLTIPWLGGSLQPPGTLLFQGYSLSAAGIEFTLSAKEDRAEVLASASGPSSTATFASDAQPRPNLLKQFEVRFGVPLRTWLNRLTVTRASCQLSRGAVRDVTAEAGVLQAGLFEHVEHPCSAQGDELSLEFAWSTGLPRSLVHSRATLLESRGNEGSSVAGAAVGAGVELRLGSDPGLTVPDSPWLAALVPCAAQSKVPFALSLVAAPRENGGVSSKLILEWSPACEDATLRCELESSGDEGTLARATP